MDHELLALGHSCLVQLRSAQRAHRCTVASHEELGADFGLVALSWVHDDDDTGVGAVLADTPRELTFGDVLDLHVDRHLERGAGRGRALETTECASTRVGLDQNLTRPPADVGVIRRLDPTKTLIVYAHVTKHMGCQLAVRVVPTILRQEADAREIQLSDALGRVRRNLALHERERVTYETLFESGHVHCAGAWREDRLVGGLYGIALGGMFFGESMFQREPDASKVAFVTLVGQLKDWGFQLVDCQQETDHLARFGATAIPREQFLDELKQLIALQNCWPA